MLKKNLFAQIIAITTVLILLGSIILGTVSYRFGEQELTNSGKLDLMHIAEGAIPVLEELNKQVESGQLSLEEAQETARTYLSGPKVEGNDNLHYDFTQSPYTYKENGYIFAYNAKGEAVVHPVLPIGKDMSQTQDKDGDYLVKDLMEKSKQSNPEDRYYEFAWPKAGEEKASKKIAYTVYYEPWEWTIIVGAYVDEFNEAMDTIKVVTTIVSLITLILSVVLIYFLLRSKLKALQEMTNATVEVANGNLNVESITYKGEDEVGRMSVAFNKMTGHLRELVQSIQTVGENTSHASHELSALSEETTASSEEIGKAMDEIAKGSVAQTADIESINNGTESLAEVMKQLTSQNNNMIDLTETSQHAVENGQAQVSTLQDANASSKAALGNIDQTVQQLNGRVRDIAGIVSTIDDIAAQTNLLALNASIEAARAGEHGKGFAVVAEEVRKLAEETNKATNEIQTMIKTIENQTEVSVKEMATTIESSQQLDTAVADTEKEFSTISNTIQDIVQAIKESSESIKSVDASIHNLFANVQSVSAVSEETSAASEEVLASVEEQIKSVRSTSVQAESLNKLSEELNELIKKFNV
ncbi:methyl-accepting chemotaxis protein [Bacillus tianshenii]|nr:methyl-accepting chemotaxis protein [Bacillus tianshenii]